MKNKWIIGLMCMALLMSLTACSKEPTPADKDGGANTETQESTLQQGAESQEGGTTESTKPQESAKPSEGDDPTESPETAEKNPEKEPAGGNQSTQGGEGESGGEPVTTIPEKLTDCTYEEYHNMTPETQQKFFNSFENVEAFFQWYNAAKAEYEKENGAIQTDGEINLDEIIGK